jgi:hypothetical protein
VGMACIVVTIVQLIPADPSGTRLPLLHRDQGRAALDPAPGTGPWLPRALFHRGKRPAT